MELPLIALDTTNGFFLANSPPLAVVVYPAYVSNALMWIHPI